MSFIGTTTPHVEDTIVAVSSATGHAPRAIVRVSGTRTRAVVASVFSPATQLQPRRLVRGQLQLSGVHSTLPATLYFFATPRSYTGQDLAEIHLIGSPPLVERLVADLLAAGARPAKPGEFTLRAFLAGKKDLPQAEAVQAVIDAGTDADLAAALTQLAGGVSRPLEMLREDLLNLLADTEAALDFADEDIEFVGQTETIARIHHAITLLENTQRQLDDRTISGRPVRVALVGLPNAGKSSLFNALAGGSALVSDIPGTTRDYLTRTLTLANVTVELIDTAGWQHATDTIEEQSQQLGREQATQADIIAWCDEHGLFPAADATSLEATGATVLRVRTKCDSDSVRVTATEIACSVVATNGLDALHTALCETVASLSRPPLAPSQSRCRHHVQDCLLRLREAHTIARNSEPPELLALSLREAIESLGEMTGSVYTNDLLDRIFSRFCIGK